MFKNNFILIMAFFFVGCSTINQLEQPTDNSLAVRYGLEEYDNNYNKKQEANYVIRQLTQLDGFSIGNTTQPEQVVYVVLDPFCRYSVAAYQNVILPEIQRGMAYKIIPISVIRKNQQGWEVAATILHAKSIDEVTAAMLTKRASSLDLKTSNSLDKNLKIHSVLSNEAYKGNYNGKLTSKIPTFYKYTENGIIRYY